MSSPRKPDKSSKEQQSQQQQPQQPVAYPQHLAAYQQYAAAMYGGGYYYQQQQQQQSYLQQPQPTYYQTAALDYSALAEIPGGAHYQVAGAPQPLQQQRIDPVQFYVRPQNPTPQHQQQEQAKSDNKWPQSLREYVASVFARAGDKRTEIETIMKNYISEVNKQGMLWQTDWTTVRIPEIEKLLPAQSLPNPEIHESRKKRVVVEETTTRKERRMRTESPLDIGRNASQDTLSNKKKKPRRFSSNPSSDSPVVEDKTPNGDVAIVGKCLTLEKKYLRLTSEPDPMTVRPLFILERAFEFILTKWKSERDYVYVCDQFKSIRQDLTVQMIKNEFTIRVYETHARIALEMGDLGEYNQCQSQLTQLYRLGVEGSVVEFTAYKILYFLLTRNRSGVGDLLMSLTPELREMKPIKHALAVRRAVASNDYHELFRLLRQVEKHGIYLMNGFVERERLRALSVIFKAYRPKISVDFLQDELGFESRDALVKFLESHYPEVDVSADSLDCKACLPFFLAASQQFTRIDIKGQL